MPSTSFSPKSELIVLESGGQLPARLRRSETGKTIVVAQSQRESSTRLLTRTTARLVDLAARGTSIDFAILSCNGSTDVVRSRARLADVILAHLKRARSSRLVLAASSTPTADMQAELVTLADRALAKIGARGGTVSIWFGDGRGDA